MVKSKVAHKFNGIVQKPTSVNFPARKYKEDKDFKYEYRCPVCDYRILSNMSAKIVCTLKGHKEPMVTV